MNEKMNVGMQQGAMAQTELSEEELAEQAMMDLDMENTQASENLTDAMDPTAIYVGNPEQPTIQQMTGTSEMLQPTVDVPSMGSIDPKRNPQELNPGLDITDPDALAPKTTTVEELAQKSGEEATGKGLVKTEDAEKEAKSQPKIEVTDEGVKYDPNYTNVISKLMGSLANTLGNDNIIGGAFRDMANNLEKMTSGRDVPKEWDQAEASGCIMPGDKKKENEAEAQAQAQNNEQPQGLDASQQGAILGSGLGMAAGTMMGAAMPGMAGVGASIGAMTGSAAGAMLGQAQAQNQQQMAEAANGVLGGVGAVAAEQAGVEGVAGVVGSGVVAGMEAAQNAGKRQEFTTEGMYDDIPTEGNDQYWAEGDKYYETENMDKVMENRAIDDVHDDTLLAMASEDYNWDQLDSAMRQLDHSMDNYALTSRDAANKEMNPHVGESYLDIMRGIQAYDQAAGERLTEQYGDDPEKLAQAQKGLDQFVGRMAAYGMGMCARDDAQFGVFTEAQRTELQNMQFSGLDKTYAEVYADQNGKKLSGEDFYDADEAMYGDAGLNDGYEPASPDDHHWEHQSGDTMICKGDPEAQTQAKTMESSGKPMSQAEQIAQADAMFGHITQQAEASNPFER